MANFRKNHHQQSSLKSGMTTKVGIFAALLAGLYFLFSQFGGDTQAIEDTWEQVTKGTAPDQIEDKPRAKLSYLPSSTTGQVVQHKYYTLSYDEAHEQAEWVAFELTRENLDKKFVDRADRFEDDPYVSTGSATWSDYKNSGYDRGHLAAAADMAFSDLAMEESFFMSNISPQARQFNKGIWRELEETTRDWAKKYKKLYVVTGPVLTERPKGRIGKNGVSIPTAFYKVLLDLEEPERKGIAFIIPNAVSFEPLYKYSTSIDEVEKRTGIDFFPNLMSKQEEAELEGRFNNDLWQFSRKKYELRVNRWNE